MFTFACDGNQITWLPYGQAHLEEQSKHSTVLEDAVRAMDVARGLLKPKERVEAENPEFKEDAKQQLHNHLNKEQVASQAGRGAKDVEREREVESPKILSRPVKEDTGRFLVIVSHKFWSFY